MCTCTVVYVVVQIFLWLKNILKQSSFVSEYDNESKKKNNENETG